MLDSVLCVLVWWLVRLRPWYSSRISDHFHTLFNYFKKTGWNLRWFNCFTVVDRPNHKLQDEPAPGRLSWKLHSRRMILVTPTSRLSLLKLLNYPIIMVLRNTKFISFKANMCLMFLALVCYLQLHIATIHLLCSMCYIIFKEWKIFWEL